MDQLDHGILSLLARNCRLGPSTIARALGSSPEMIHHRIARLEKSEVIEHYLVVLNTRPLGLMRYMILLRFDSRGQDIEQIAQPLFEHPSVLWVNTLIGSYDLHVLVDAVGDYDLSRIRDELISLLTERVRRCITMNELYDLQFTNLLPHLDPSLAIEPLDDGSFSDISFKASFPASKPGEVVRLGSIDMDLIRALGEAPRASLSELSRTVDRDRQTVKRHIVRLIEKDVILSFGISLDASAFGYLTYYVLFRLEKGFSEECLKQTFSNLPEVFWAGVLLGEYDLICYLNARNPNELRSSLNKIRKGIGRYVQHYELMLADRVLYWNLVSEASYSHLRAAV